MYLDVPQSENNLIPANLVRVENLEDVFTSTKHRREAACMTEESFSKADHASSSSAQEVTDV